MALALAAVGRATGPVRRPEPPKFDYSAQPKEEVQLCALCAGTSFVVIEHRDRYGFEAPANYCMGCGLVFLSPLMTKDAYREFYGGAYRELIGFISGKESTPETLASSQRLYARWLGGFLEPFVASISRTLLDIGGSTGVVAEALCEKFGLDGTVLDPAANELKHTKLEAAPMMFEDYHTDRTFDLVTICQTIDHFRDPMSALKKAWGLLSPRGRLFVDAVDFRATYLRRGSVRQAIKIDHPVYLTEATMERMLRLRKFRVLRKVYAPDYLHTGYVCEKVEVAELGPWHHDPVKDLAEIREVQTRGSKWQR